MPIDDRNPSGIALPAYVLLRPEGVFINLSPPPAQDILQGFVTRLFSNDAFFVGLDYDCFLHLLFGIDLKTPPIDNATEARLADSIESFPPEHMEFYKTAKIMDNGVRAEYMFEPIFKLDFDEFVANMWNKGVRFGIDASAVRDVIKSGASKRIDFAHQLDPTESKDAEVVEESEHLRQDNAPMILADGKADLRRAKNRFPQVAKNELMLRKIPRQLGKPGYRVTGTVIEPRIPDDIELSKLAGEGTRIDQKPGSEVLVANIDGFLDIDTISGVICVTTKIENKGGISAKSSGDIVLTVDDYTEHGEVQEGRNVEGNHMTFLSDVFGNVVSKGGGIELAKNISRGRAQSIAGDITVKGKVIGSTLEAWDGKISIEFAEGSLIMGKSVSIKKAVNCEIVGEELQLEITEGSAIAGKHLQITSTNMHKNREAVISVILPDMLGYDKKIAEAKTLLSKIQNTIRAKNQEIAATNPGFTKFLAMTEKLRAGTVKFSPEQQAAWQQVTNQFAPLMKGNDDLMQKGKVLEDSIQLLLQKRATCGSGESCKIEQILGDTIVRKISTSSGLSSLKELDEPDLRSKLKELGDMQERILTGNKGSLDWHFTIPELPASEEQLKRG